MKATLVIEGKEFPIEINDPELQKLIAPPKKKTGYERVKGKEYYWVHADFSECEIDEDDVGANQEYDCANYYSDDTVAENNARADKLMRQLRRFAVENRENTPNWNDKHEAKWYLFFDYTCNDIFADDFYYIRDLFVVYFHSKINNSIFSNIARRCSDLIITGE